LMESPHQRHSQIAPGTVDSRLTLLIIEPTSSVRSPNRRLESGSGNCLHEANHPKPATYNGTEFPPNKKPNIRGTLLCKDVPVFDEAPID
jgi:hypothetical protein